MTATLATPAAPPWALTCWVDNRHIFVELPTKGSQPYVMKFPLSEGGLTKALNILRDRGTEAKAPVYVEPSFRASNKQGTVGSASQREAARNVLRKLGLVT